MIRDCFGIAGLGLMAWGLEMFSKPVALIFAGMALLACALLVPERKKKADQ